MRAAATKTMDKGEDALDDAPWREFGIDAEKQKRIEEYIEQKRRKIDSGA